MTYLLTYLEAAQIATDNVCAVCRSPLIIVPWKLSEDGKWQYRLICANCRLSLPGWLPRAEAVGELNLPASPNRVNRFWSYVDIPRLSNGDPDITACWNWLRSTDRAGYGWFRGDTRVERVNRFGYAISRPYETMEPMLVAMHTCDNPTCVNIATHVCLETRSKNTRDVFFKNRRSGKKMTIAAVRRFMEAAKTGLSTRQLSEMFGVGEWMAQAILRGYSWYWVTGVPRAIPKPKSKPNNPQQESAECR